MILNRILFGLSKRLANQMSRKLVENVISSPQLQLIKSLQSSETIENKQPTIYIPSNVLLYSVRNQYFR